MNEKLLKQKLRMKKKKIRMTKLPGKEWGLDRTLGLSCSCPVLGELHKIKMRTLKTLRSMISVGGRSVQSLWIIHSSNTEFFPPKNSIQNKMFIYSSIQFNMKYSIQICNTTYRTYIIGDRENVIQNVKQNRN